MKVATWRGEANFTIDEAPDPVPEAGQVVIKVDTVGICGSDVHLTQGLFPGEPPRVLGHEFSGEIVETGPDPALDGVVRWRRADLKRVIEERFGVVYAERTISDLLARLSFSYISGRPQHPRQDPQVLETFKKTSPAHSQPT